MVVLPRWGLGDFPEDYGSTRAKVWLPLEFLHDLNRCRDLNSRFKTLFTLLSLPLVFLMLFFAPKSAIGIFQSLLDPKMWQALFKSHPRHGEADGIELSRACQQICHTKPESEAEVSKRFWQLRHTLEWYSGRMHNIQPFIKSSDFLKDIARQDITVVPEIARYHQNREIKFEDNSQVEADVVVLCTGFKSLLPFLEHSELNAHQLYKNTFIPGKSTLAFIGFVRPNIGATPPLSEMQGRWFSRLLSGGWQLPEKEIMENAIAQNIQTYNYNYPLHAKRLTSLVNYHLYLYEIAGYIGCRPNLWQLLSKPKMFMAILFGPFASFQYRIHGYGKDPQAVEKAISELEPLPFERVVWHASLYFLLKPLFVLLGSLGFKRFRPTF